MAFEVTCSQCHGRLMVQQAGQVVACPHCGTHLAIPDATEAEVAEAPSTEAEVGSVAEEGPAADTTEASEPDTTESSEAAVVGQETLDEIPVPVASPDGDETEASGSAEPSGDQVAEDAGTDIVAEVPEVVSAENSFASSAPDFGVGFGSAPAQDNPFAGGDFSFGDADTSGATTVDEVVPVPLESGSNDVPEIAAATDVANDSSAEPAVETADQLPEAVAEVVAGTSPFPAAVGGSDTVATGATADSSTVESNVGTAEPVANAASATPTAANSYQPIVPAGANTVPRGKYVLVLSWASAATIAALFLAYLLTTAQTSQLESLPDVKPPKKDDKIAYKLVPEDVAMPPGHVLALGDTRRYGNLKVSVVRVTRGPIQFEHYDSSSTRTKGDGPEVLKLWLRFENVSSDQSIAPLDELVFQRDDRDFENVRSNTFLARASQKSKSGDRLMVYDLNTSGDWNLKAQQISHEIPPGGQLETYIPTTPEGLNAVLGSDEELVWRVHFRKGYSPKNYGVTTVIEVTFRESDIEPDSSAPASASPPASDNGSRNA